MKERRTRFIRFLAIALVILIPMAVLAAYAKTVILDGTGLSGDYAADGRIRTCMLDPSATYGEIARFTIENYPGNKTFTGGDTVTMKLYVRDTTVITPARDPRIDNAGI